MDIASTSIHIVSHLAARVAYWNADQKCVFANAAYCKRFGRTPEDIRGISMSELLGSVYEQNLPYILGVLGGTKQIFERQLVLPGGEIQECLTTYVPDVRGGVVRGFSAHVADITLLRQREAAIEEIIHEAVEVLERTKRSFRSKELGALRERLLQKKRDLNQARRGPIHAGR